MVLAEVGLHLPDNVIRALDLERDLVVEDLRHVAHGDLRRLPPRIGTRGGPGV